MKFLLTALLLGSMVSLSAQFGFHGYLQQQDAPDWETAVNEAFSDKQPADFLRRGYRFGADYWFKPIDDVRITATPGVSYGVSSTSGAYPDGGTAVTVRTHRLQQVGLQVPVNVYPFDFYGDCDCPTWSKSEPFLKKGLFLQLMPGAYLNTYRRSEVVSTATTTQSFRLRHQNVNVSLGAGVGLDIGFSDLVTLSPTVRYVHHFGKQWTDLTSAITPESAPNAEFRSSLRAWEFGARLGIRLDY